MWALFSFWKGDVIYGKQIAGVPKNVGRGAAAADRIIRSRVDFEITIECLIDHYLLQSFYYYA